MPEEVPATLPLREEVLRNQTLSRLEEIEEVSDDTVTNSSMASNRSEAYFESSRPKSHNYPIVGLSNESKTSCYINAVL